MMRPRRTDTGERLETFDGRAMAIPPTNPESGLHKGPAGVCDQTARLHLTANAPSIPAAVHIALGGGRFVTVERSEQDRSQPTLVAGGPIC